MVTRDQVRKDTTGATLLPCGSLTLGEANHRVVGRGSRGEGLGPFTNSQDLPVVQVS